MQNRRKEFRWTWSYIEGIAKEEVGMVLTIKIEAFVWDNKREWETNQCQRTGDKRRKER